MRTIDWYIDRARQIHGVASDPKIARMLDQSHAAVSGWRTRRAWPLDDTMIALADLCSVSAEEALLDLNRWRAKSPAVRHVYDQIAEKISRVTATVIIALPLAGLLTFGQGTISEQARAGSARSIYIMENYRAIAKRLGFDVQWP